MVRLLVDYGALLYLRDASGLTPFHLAATKRDILKYLLVDVCYSEVQQPLDCKGLLPQHYALLRKSFDCLLLMINTSTQSLSGEKSISSSNCWQWVCGCRGSAARSYLKKGLKSGRVDVNGVDTLGCTVLHWAVVRDDWRKTALLLKYGARPTARSGVQLGQLTPLHIASLFCQLESLKIMLDHQVSS